MNGLDAGEYDDKPDIGYAIHFAVADGGARGWFDFTAQHNVTMWRWLIAATFISEMKRENGTTTVTESDGTSSQVAIYPMARRGLWFTRSRNVWRWLTTWRAQWLSATALSREQRTPLFLSGHDRHGARRVDPVRA